MRRIAFGAPAAGALASRPDWGAKGEVTPLAQAGPGMGPNCHAVYGVANAWEFTAGHRGRKNLAFCDGRVQATTIQDAVLDHSPDAMRPWKRDEQTHQERIGP